MAFNLFVAQAADGNSASFATTASMQTTVATIAAWGNFGAPGSLAVKLSPDNGTTWIDFPTPITFTANGTKQVHIPQGVRIRAELLGAVAPSVNCTVYGAE